MWNLLVRRDDLRRTELRQVQAAALAEGQALLEVESFALTSNNVTYAAMGEAFGYWKFFPAPEGFGRVPVWGHAKVVASRTDATCLDQRVFGYLPMSTHLVVQPIADPARPGGFVDASPHRAALPATYNAYSAARGDAAENQRAVLRPLFMTSRLLDLELAESCVRTAILTSASSKTSMGLAWLIGRRGGRVVGLTSPRGKAVLEGKGLYDQLLTYDEIGAIELEGAGGLVDMAGAADVAEAVHRGLAERLTLSLLVGATHWEGARPRVPLPGPPPTMFFAPNVLRRLAASPEGQAFIAAFEAVMAEFIAASPWLRIVTHHGPEALAKVWVEVVGGGGAPDEGLIVRP